MKRARSFSGRDKQKWSATKNEKDGESMYNRKSTDNNAFQEFSLMSLTEHLVLILVSLFRSLYSG